MMSTIYAEAAPKVRFCDYTAMWSAQFQSKNLRQLIL